MTEGHTAGKPKRRKKRTKRLSVILLIELLVLLIMAGSYFLITKYGMNDGSSDKTPINSEKNDGKGKNNDKQNTEEELSPEELEALREQERLMREIAERDALIEKAKKLTLSYDYDGAIELIRSYQGKDVGYEVYPALVSALNELEKEKASLVLYGGSYTSVTQINHIFFHSLIADTSKAFDNDYDSVGYNMYMTTIDEFKKMMQSMYEDGYVLVSVHDLVKLVTDENGNTKYVPAEIYLPAGKKPFVLSQDDVSYYEYMEGDGFASRLVLDDDGKVTCEMILDDGSVVRGAYDLIPILDEFVEEHPDFSYKGAKGLIALTGYEGVLGYRTNELTSPTYEQDKETVKEIVRVMKENGWEFASHSYYHRNLQEKSAAFLRDDTERWKKEVESIIGPTDVYVFPFGVDIETTMDHYKSEKYAILKEAGFNFFHGVYSKPWMHIKNDYVRMTRRPLDGQAMLEFPERLADLFDLNEIIDPARPPKNW